MLFKMLSVSYKRFWIALKQRSIKTYSIVSTNNLAVKHPLFEYARSFDFIIVTDVGLINVDVKIGIKNFLPFRRSR